MEGDLLEISGEDADSLLLQHNQSPIGDVSTFNASLFSCSPLNFPESNPPDVKAVNPMHSSNADKESVNDNVINKSELPKLSLEPHQMKRKKKGGYNLRKSLAWDRAFFTEEGVLNSTELSLISGDFGKLNGGTLSVIEEEEGRESLSGDSIDLQALENNLFKETPLNNSATTEEKKVGGSLLQKSSGSAPRSAVRQNVLSVHDVNRSGSKRSGCPRPVLSSALKRPANLNITKAATKEPKISKLPAPKPASSVLSTTFKSVPNINKPKRNQSAQAGSKKSTRSSQNDAKAGLSSRSQITKPSAQQAKRMVGSSALASPASTCSQNPLVTKADNVLKVKEDAIVAAGDRSINHEANSNKIATIPPNGAHSGGNTQYAQPRMAKPSGLRMPSPSLGFFSQSKTNASHNLRKSTQPSNQPKSNIPNLKKPCVLKSTCESTTSSMQVPTVSNGVAAITNPGVSSLASSVSLGVNSLCQDIRPTSQIPRVEVKVLCNSDNHQSMNNNQHLHTFEDDIKLQIDENLKLLGTDDKILLKSQSSEQGKLDYKRRADMASSQTPNQLGDEFKYHNFVSPHSLQRKGTSKTNVGANQLSGNDQHGSLMEDSNLFPKLCPIDVNVNDIHGSSVNDDQISSMHGSHELPSKQAEQAKPCTFNNDQMVNETERPHINDSIMLKEGGASEGFLSYDGGQSTGISQKVRDSSASELERSNALSHCRDRIQGTDDAGEVADIDLKSHVGNAQIDSFEVDLSLENGNSLLNDSEANDPDLLADQVKEKLVEQQPLPDHDIVERVFQDNFGSQSTDCSLHEENFSSERILAESNLQSSKYVGAELADTSQNELGNSGAPLIPTEVKNGGHEMADAVQGLYVENAVSVSTDMLCNSGIEHLAEAKSEGLRTVEDQVTIAINACDIGVTDDGQSCGQLVGNEIDKFHLLSHTSPVVQCKGYSEMDDIIGLKSVEGNQHILSAKCSSDIFEPEQINCCQVDNSVMLTSSSLDKQYDLEKPIAQAELVHSSEANISSQENQMPETHHSLLFLDGNFFQKSHSFDSDHANVDSKDKSTVRQESEGPDLSEVECPDEPDEECGLVDEMTTRSFQEDAYCHSFDDSSRHLSSLAENNNSAVVVEDLNEPPEQDAVIVEEILSDKFQFSANEEVSCSVKIKVPDNSHDHYDDMIFRPDNEQSGQATSLNAVFSSVSEDELSGAGSTCNSQAFSSLIEEPTSLTGNVILEEVNISEKDVPQELNSALISVEAENRTTLSENNDGNDKKQDAAVIKPPPNAIPFSDEWLAAFEAAGEEILTIKSGAVQHSPKDKILPEPSPWSPVKRKNNQGIGPFDCTKYTNSNLPPPASES